MFHTQMRFADGAVLLSVLLLAVLLLLLPFLGKESASELVIYTPAGSSSYSLLQDREIVVTSGSYSLTVCIQNGEASVLQSSCPDGICISSGSIRRAGESILCAPAGVRLLIVSDKEGGIDFVAG